MSSTLQTIGLGPCIALSLYDPSTQVAALSHNDAKDFRRMVTSMVESLERNGANPDLLEARIVGGMEGLENTIWQGLRATVTGQASGWVGWRCG